MTQTVGVRIAIVGTTASGKSALAELVANRLAARGRLGEIVSADSMCVYRGMNVGTAKPTVADQQRWPTHGIDLVNPDEEFSVAEFQRYAFGVIREIEQRGAIPILVGGTGLYVDAVVNELTMPPQFAQIKASLLAELTSGVSILDLYARLAILDPVAAKRMEPNNERRIVRALEVCLGSGKPFSSFGPGIVQAAGASLASACGASESSAGGSLGGEVSAGRVSGSSAGGVWAGGVWAGGVWGGGVSSSGVSVGGVSAGGVSGSGVSAAGVSGGIPTTGVSGGELSVSGETGVSVAGGQVKGGQPLTSSPLRNSGSGVSGDGSASTSWLLCGPTWPRAMLRERIAERFAQQLADGFEEEASLLLETFGETLSKTARQALGYREFWAHRNGGCSRDEAVAQAIVRTGQFAVRQERWFRRDQRIRWIESSELSLQADLLAESLVREAE